MLYCIKETYSLIGSFIYLIKFFRYLDLKNHLQFCIILYLQINKISFLFFIIFNYQLQQINFAYFN